MSSLASQARVRAPRFTEAIEKARLTLVPTRRVQAPRAPFAVLVFAILGIGVLGLLMFNTHMQQGSFYATKLQHEADRLTARQQQLDLQLQGLRDPQRLAKAAKALGMVAPSVPVFVDLSDGRTIGVPTPATGNDGVSINPPAAALPAGLDPAPIVHRVVLSPTTPSVNTQAANGPASATKTTGTGKKKVQPAH